MRCLACPSEETKVTDSRLTGEGYSIRRRRECGKCGFRFSTTEQMEILNLTVQKQSGLKESYTREKLIRGLRKALEKRPASEERFTRLVGDIERKIQLASDRAMGGAEEESPRLEIRSSTIGDIVMAALKRFDKVAYLRFASVYQAFEDLEAFEQAIELMKTKKSRNGKLASDRRLKIH